VNLIWPRGNKKSLGDDFNQGAFKKSIFPTKGIVLNYG